MDHAEVRAWLEDAAVEPGGLDRPPDPEVAAHLERCPACSAEREALHATAVALDLTMGPPLAARSRVLGNVRQVGRQRRLVARPPVDQPAGVAGGRMRGWLGRPSPRMAAAALAAAVLLFGAGALTGVLLRSADDG